MNKKVKKFLKIVITTLIAIFVALIIALIIFVTVYLYYHQKNSLPVVAYPEEGRLIYDGRGYVFIGYVNTVELSQIDLIPLGEVKPYDFATTWIRNNGVLAIEGYEDRILLIYQFHSPYVLYSTDPNYTVEEFLKLIENLPETQ